MKDDIGDGGYLKQEGQGRAYRHADPEWRAAVMVAMKDACLRLPFICADDVWDQLYLNHHGNPPTTHNNVAMGSLFKPAVRLGYFVETDRKVKSRRSLQHNAELKVWRSLLYRVRREF